MTNDEMVEAAWRVAPRPEDVNAALLAAAQKGGAGDWINLGQEYSKFYRAVKAGSPLHHVPELHSFGVLVLGFGVALALGRVEDGKAIADAAAKYQAEPEPRLFEEIGATVRSVLEALLMSSGEAGPSTGTSTH